MSSIRRREIIGTAVSITDYEELLTAIDDAVERRTPMTICCAPASTLIFARRNPQLRSALAAADVVTPDGMGVVHAARLLGEQLPGRVYGPDLMEMQCARAEKHGHRIWLHGGHDQDALSDLRENLRNRFPDLIVAGSECPAFREPTEPERAATIKQINDSGADIVWVGLGSPKQELWMHEMREELSAPVLCGVGAAFDFHAGRVEQAPRFIRDNGFEWAYRLAREPLRLGRRYLGTLPHFVVLVVAQAIKERLSR